MLASFLPRSALECRFLGVAAHTGIRASTSHTKQTRRSIHGQSSGRFIRSFSSCDASQENAMTLAKPAPSFDSLLESGTLTTVKLPNMGKNLTKCKIYRWVKRPGEFVGVDDLLCIIESDLIFGNVYSRVAGTLIERVNQEGCTVSVGSDLAVLVDREMVPPGLSVSSSFSFNSGGRREFSTLKFAPVASLAKTSLVELSKALPKYVPSISFGRSKGALLKPPERALAAGPSPAATGGVQPGKAGRPPQVLDDFFKSPYRTWFRRLSEEEINLVNHGTVDKKG